jgi:Asp-tRNA(Asn)/Glu-tRNA(Gln) amidotransferase A subunit family amidase
MNSQAPVRKAAASCRSLRDRLSAFVKIADVPLKGISGPLAGLPIAIKDMIDIERQVIWLSVIALGRFQGAIRNMD